MNSRRQMVASNQHAVKWLLKNGYDHIHLKPHTRYADTVFGRNGNYKVTDYFNLWDGFASNPVGGITWIQIKTNHWPKTAPITKFLKSVNCSCMAIKVSTPTKKNKKYTVKSRFY